jgi:hypothetical protein
MSEVLTGEVRQSTLGAYSENTRPTLPMLKMGVPFGATKWDRFALGGQMFNMHQAALGTAIAGSAADNAGIVLTAPTIHLTVPLGTVMFPRRFDLALVNTGVDNELAIAYTTTDSFTSGGTACLPANWRSGGAASACTNAVVAAGSAIIEAALVGVRVLWQRVIPLAAVFATNYTLQYNETVEWDDLHPVIGPASFLVFLSAKTAANTHYFSLDWAEVQLANI